MFDACLGSKKPTQQSQPTEPQTVRDPPRIEKRKKYLVLVRHGERIDETFPEQTEDRGDEYWDTGITNRGKQHSQQTGAAILKLLDEWGLLDQMLEQHTQAGKTFWVIRKIRFISSIFYRCLQTTQCIRRGMEEYLQQQLQLNASEIQKLKSPTAADTAKGQRRSDVLNAILDLLKTRSTHIEEACSEKIAGVPPSVINKLRIEKDKAKCLQEFADLKIVTGEIFDYSGKHKHLAVKKMFNKGPDIYNACIDFYRRIIKRLLEAPNHDVYIVVAHGMYVKVLLWFLEIELSGAAKTVHYNSTTIVELDDVLRSGGSLEEGVQPKPVIINQVLHNRV